jgi:hypothetical protein
LKGKNTFSKCLILDTMILMRKLFPIEHQWSLNYFLKKCGQSLKLEVNK